MLRDDEARWGVKNEKRVRVCKSGPLSHVSSAIRDYFRHFSTRTLPSDYLVLQTAIQGRNDKFIY